MLFHGAFQYMDVHQLRLEQPLFHNWPYGLRFEIGPTDIEVWADFDKGLLDNDYFKVALERAIALFETAFLPNDHISLVYQCFSDGRRKIRKGSFLFKQIADLNARTIKFSACRDIYTYELTFRRYCWRRVSISNLTTQHIGYKNILKAVSHCDFRSRRKPSICGEVYFINHTQDLVLLLYDDRGMDVVSSRKEPLIPLYEQHRDWILDRNRTQIQKVFS